MTITNRVSLKSVEFGVTSIDDVVDAPTIGSATAGVESATVAYTAAATGGAATSFTAISTPGSITGSSATSPITVSGLTGGTAYTFKVYGANASGTWSAVQSSASNSITAAYAGMFDSIATSTPTSGSSVTFSSISSSYQHLQLRCLIVGTSNGRIQFNGDTSSANYSIQWGPYSTGNNINYDLYGTGVYAGFPYQGSAQTGTPQFIIVDIHNYASTSIKKTVHMYYGSGFTGSIGQQFTGFVEGAWLSTSAINSITVTSGTYSSGTQLALYGTKVS